tara:strand:- start:17161 stop:18759 length:1599 start_codon:yes stop_codon:yes gene_type:complete
MNNEFPFNHFLNFDKNNNKINNLNTNNTPKTDFMTQALQSENSEIKQENQEVGQDSEFQMLSDEIISQLKSSLSPEKYKAYFLNTFFVNNITHEDVEFLVTNNFIKKVINNNYLQQVKDILFKCLGKHYNVKIEVMGHGTSSNPSPSNNTSQMNTKVESGQPKFKLSSQNNASRQEIEQEVESEYIKYSHTPKSMGRIDRSKTFSNFVVGPSNNMAYAFSLAVAKDPGAVYPQLYIYGNSGLGKTHILHALCNNIIENKPHLRICFTNANEFMSEMVVAIQGNNIAEFRRKYTELVDLLIIDDIHELKNKARTQSEFFFIFNELQSKGKQLVFTSDKQPRDISGIEDRIKTRLSSALLIDIQQPDLETRIAILKKKANEKDIYLDDEVINLIASCVKTNVRELEGNLVKLGAYSDLMNVDIDIEIAKKQLNFKENSDHKEITIDIISKAVAGYFKIAIGDIKGKTRKKEIALARHIAMYMSHKILKKTLEDIGEYFDNRDHSTVIHGIRKVQNLISKDSGLSQQIYEIESRL